MGSPSACNGTLSATSVRSDSCRPPLRFVPGSLSARIRDSLSLVGGVPHSVTAIPSDLAHVPVAPAPGLVPVQAHSTCVSEHEKYALGATKPGGFASQGFFHEGQGQVAAAAAAGADGGEAVGLQFLSEYPPWRCSCCNVSCTSRETLMGHAAGAKHKRRVSGAWVHVGEVGKRVGGGGCGGVR
jgi:hypothetical protein